MVDFERFRSEKNRNFRKGRAKEEKRSRNFSRQDFLPSIAKALISLNSIFQHPVMYRGGSRERKRPAVDPRKRPAGFPEGAPFVKSRENPGFPFSPQVEFKLESKPEVNCFKDKLSYMEPSKLCVLL